MSATPLSVWIFHRGALGDSVILWPIFRALKAAGNRVKLVTDREKADLASREVGIDAVDIEQPRFNQLWIPLGAVEPIHGVDVVYSFHADGRRGIWADNAKRAFPGARVRIIDRRPDQRLAHRLTTVGAKLSGVEAGDVRWTLRDYVPGAEPQLRANPGGPVVIHVGAGAESKRWPMDRWAVLVREFRWRALNVDVLAGEVEEERFSSGDRRIFADLGGRILHSLIDLADTLRPARLFVGADSGPTHLAAALGVNTAAIFGPTDVHRWMPRGPGVIALAPRNPLRIDQIRTQDVVASLASWLDRPGK